MSGGSPDTSLEAAQFLLNRQNKYGGTHKPGVSGRWRNLWRLPRTKEGPAVCLLTVRQLQLEIFKNVLDKLHFSDVNTLEIMLMKTQPDATICRYLFTAKSLYMYRVSQHPLTGVLKSVTAATGTATSLQRGLQATLEGSSCTSIMTCTGGFGYSF